MKKTIKKLMVISFVLILSALQFSTGFAQNKIFVKNPGKSNEVASNQAKKALIEVPEILGNRGDDLVMLFENEAARIQDLKKGHALNQQDLSKMPKLLNLKIDVLEGEVLFEALLDYNKTIYKMNSVGLMYSSDGDPALFSYENLLLAEMRDSSGIHFVRFWIDNKNKEISLILQLENTKEVLSFRAAVEDLPFDILMKAKDNHLSGRDLMQKLISLYSADKNLLDRSDSGSRGGLRSGTVTPPKPIKNTNHENGLIEQNSQDNLESSRDISSLDSKSKEEMTLLDYARLWIFFYNVVI